MIVVKMTPAEYQDWIWRDVPDVPIEGLRGMSTTGSVTCFPEERHKRWLELTQWAT